MGRRGKQLDFYAFQDKKRVPPGSAYAESCCSSPGSLNLPHHCGPRFVHRPWRDSDLGLFHPDGCTPGDSHHRHKGRFRPCSAPHPGTRAYLHPGTFRVVHALGLPGMGPPIPSPWDGVFLDQTDRDTGWLRIMTATAGIFQACAGPPALRSALLGGRGVFWLLGTSQVLR